MIHELVERKGSSAAAAGMINPITGRGWNLSRNFAEELPRALRFYEEIGKLTGVDYFQSHAIRRWIGSEKEAAKVTAKAGAPELDKWIDQKASDLPRHLIVCGGGRVRTRSFLETTRRFFEGKGLYRMGETPPKDAVQVDCRGATALLEQGGDFEGKHRCAKGEILHLKFAQSGSQMIEVKDGKWLIPLGNDEYLSGATYEWDELDYRPTLEARDSLLRWNGQWTNGHIEVLEHRVGIRPIISQSHPVTKQMSEKRWIFNGLGSKGCLYAPSAAERLASLLP